MGQKCRYIVILLALLQFTVTHLSHNLVGHQKQKEMRSTYKLHIN